MSPELEPLLWWEVFSRGDDNDVADCGGVAVLTLIRGTPAPRCRCSYPTCCAAPGGLAVAMTEAMV